MDALTSRETAIRARLLRAARDHGRFTRLSLVPWLTNFSHGRVMRALQALKATPDHGVSVLVSLLDHADNSVAEWAATYLLPFREELAVGALERLSAGQGLHALGSRMVLQAWREGSLRFVEWP